MVHGVFAAIAVVLGAASPARAQCTTCSPLSLPSGSLVGQDLEAARRSTWAVLTQATSGWVGFPRQVADNEPIRTRESARFDLFLTTLQASALHKSGLGLDAVLPFGVLASRTGEERRRDASFGDAEVRPRMTTLVGRSLRLTGIAGAALPTGAYTARSGPGALGEGARTITVGRGVFWALAHVEARVEPVRWVAMTASVEGRAPLGAASDGFRWGPELRTIGEVEGRPLRQLGIALAGEMQVRGSGSVIDPFLNERVDSTNVGARVFSVLPSVRVSFDNGIFTSVSGRIPLYQDLDGLQFRQGPGVFAGVGWVLPVGAPASAPPPPPAEKAVTATVAPRWIVREYGADWCDACKKLEPLFAAARRDDVRFERVDVTNWSEDELARRVPGAKALPVVEIFRGDGSLIARLEGKQTFTFRDHLEETRP